MPRPVKIEIDHDDAAQQPLIEMLATSMAEKKPVVWAYWDKVVVFQVEKMEGHTGSSVGVFHCVMGEAPK